MTAPTGGPLPPNTKATVTTSAMDSGVTFDPSIPVHNPFTTLEDLEGDLCNGSLANVTPPLTFLKTEVAMAEGIVTENGMSNPLPCTLSTKKSRRREEEQEEGEEGERGTKRGRV